MVKKMSRANSRLLINEPPLQILPSLAKVVGLNEAVVLQQVHYWIDTNERAGKNVRDGYVWTYRTYESWQENDFPFWSVRTVKRAFSSLKRQGLLVAGNYNDMKFDKTVWWRIDYDALHALEDDPVSLRECQNDPTRVSKWPDGECQNDPHYTRDKKETRERDTTDDPNGIVPESPSGTERQSHNEGQVLSTGATLPGMPEPVETGTAKKRGTAKREGGAEKVSPVTAILEAYCAAVGVERLTNYGKAGAQAKKLVEAGFTPEDIPSMVAWIRGQSWLNGGFDLGTLLNQADKWRATQTKPKGPKRFVV